MPSGFRCTAPRETAGVAWLSADGELDVAVTGELERALGAALDTCSLVVLDVEALTFIDSAGVRTIADASARAASSDRRLLLASPPAHVRRLIDLCDEDGTIAVLDADRTADSDR